MPLSPAPEPPPSAPPADLGTLVDMGDAPPPPTASPDPPPSPIQDDDA